MKCSRQSAAVIAVMLLAVSQAHGLAFRSIDGSGNNVANPTWGTADIALLRLGDAAYEDGLSEPRGGFASSLPSARAVSNAASAQGDLTRNSKGASDWLWQWGQFLDHDIDLTGSASPAEPFNIPVPTGDPVFDMGGMGGKEMGLSRSVYEVDGSGVRQQVNQITAYIDASNVYGSSAATAMQLRELSGGRMKTSAGNLLPENPAAPGSGLFLAGDVRANEQIGLTATHTLFVREHNRLAGALQQRLDDGDAALTAKFNASGLSEDEFLYQATRKVVGGYMQKVTYEEFLPMLLGDALGAYGGYDDTVNAGIVNEFSTAAYRVGHTMLSPQLLRLNDDGSVAAEGHIALRHAFFNPSEIHDHGIDSLLKGLASAHAQEIDTRIIDDVRNFLFGLSGTGFDLASLNMQRGRDHGLPSINELRVDALGLTAYADFAELAGGNLELAAALASVYDSIDDVDLWIGGLAELHVDGAMVGETFMAIITDQFRRLRDGDRFFYLGELDHLLMLDPEFGSTRLSDIIVRNTSLTALQRNVFAAQLPPSIPEPATALLGVSGVCGVLLRRVR